MAIMATPWLWAIFVNHATVMVTQIPINQIGVITERENVWNALETQPAGNVISVLKVITEIHYLENAKVK